MKLKIKASNAKKNKYKDRIEENVNKSTDFPLG